MHLARCPECELTHGRMLQGKTKSQGTEAAAEAPATTSAPAAGTATGAGKLDDILAAAQKRDFSDKSVTPYSLSLSDSLTLCLCLCTRCGRLAQGQLAVKRCITHIKRLLVYRQNEVFYKAPGSVEGNDMWISDLTGCTVSVCDRSNGARIDNVRDCTIMFGQWSSEQEKHSCSSHSDLITFNVHNLSLMPFWDAGPISGSVHIEKAHNCTFVVASRQIRIHEATDCRFFLNVRSGPIIEHSTTCHFGPYSLQ